MKITATALHNILLKENNRELTIEQGQQFIAYNYVFLYDDMLIDLHKLESMFEIVEDKPEVYKLFKVQILHDMTITDVNGNTKLWEAGKEFTINNEITAVDNCMFDLFAWTANCKVTPVADEPVPPEPVLTNRILYTVVEGGTQPTSTWITTNCSDNVFDAETGEGYLELNEGVTTIECPAGEETYPNMFDDSGDDSNIATLVIPTQITTVGEDAFSGCTSLTSITIPDSVTSIGAGAFGGCTGLTSVTIPNSVTSIGNGAFSHSGLTSIIIPDSVTSIGAGAFDSCTGLTSVTIPNSVTSIGNGAFGSCTGLTSVTIPNSVTSIAGSTFKNCTGLTSVTIPNSVTSIGNGSFCPSGLTSIIIPDSVTSIGDAAFADCTSLASVTCFATTPPTLGTDAFRGINTTTCGVPEALISAYQGDASWSVVFTTFVAIS